MFYHEQRDGNAEDIKGLIRLDFSFIKGQKPEGFSTVIEHRGGSKYRRDVLDPVKLPKSDEMIIVPMSPDHSIDMRGSVSGEAAGGDPVMNR